VKTPICPLARLGALAGVLSRVLPYNDARTGEPDPLTADIEEIVRWSENDGTSQRYEEVVDCLGSECAWWTGQPRAEGRCGIGRGNLFKDPGYPWPWEEQS
jgi:hypothetical protein